MVRFGDVGHEWLEDDAGFLLILDVWPILPEVNTVLHGVRFSVFVHEILFDFRSHVKEECFWNRSFKSLDSASCKFERFRELVSFHFLIVRRSAHVHVDLRCVGMEDHVDSGKTRTFVKL